MEQQVRTLCFSSAVAKKIFITIMCITTNSTVYQSTMTYNVQYIPKMTRREFLVFIILPGTYTRTCSCVAHQL